MIGMRDGTVNVPIVILSPFPRLRCRTFEPGRPHRAALPSKNLREPASNVTAVLSHALPEVQLNYF
jgi:hypothetical protein